MIKYPTAEAVMPNKIPIIILFTEDLVIRYVAVAPDKLPTPPLIMARDDWLSHQGKLKVTTNA